MFTKNECNKESGICILKTYVRFPWRFRHYKLQNCCKKKKAFHNDTVCSPTLLNSTGEHFRLCSVCERLKVRGEKWKDSLAVEGWGERGISVKVRLIGHTVTADAHLVSAWRCCGKPDRVTHEYTTWWAAWSFKAYWHQMQQNVSFIDQDALYMPVLVFQLYISAFSKSNYAIMC